MAPIASDYSTACEESLKQDQMKQAGNALYCYNSVKAGNVEMVMGWLTPLQIRDAIFIDEIFLCSSSVNI
jgi:hypothetical protein